VHAPRFALQVEHKSDVQQHWRPSTVSKVFAATMATQTITQLDKMEPHLRPSSESDILVAERFSQDVSKDEYDRAVNIIESRLDNMHLIEAPVVLNLAPNRPELLLEAQYQPAKLNIVLDPKQKEDVKSKVYIKARDVKRFADGIMEPRYAQRWGLFHIASGPTRVGIKLVDAICPFGVQHPKLSRLNLDDLPKPTEDIEQVKADVDKWGYGFIKNALTADETARLRKRLMDQARGEKEAGRGFFGKA
jgi:hypothetical protein